MRYSVVVLRLVFIASLAVLAPGNSWASKLFQAAQMYSPGGVTAVSIAVADVNGDGKPDIVVANGCVLDPNCMGAIAVLLGNGDGTFQAAKSFISGLALTSSVAVADVNRDGKPDLVLSTGITCSPACAGMGSVLLGNGDGTFGTFHTFLTGGYEAGAVAIADANGDGKPDILVSNGFENSNLSGHGSLGVLLGNGDGTFQSAQTYDTGDLDPQSLVIGKLNDNGKLDAVLVHPDGNLAVLLGNGDGSFQAAQIYRTGGALSYSVAIADVNGDGKPDLIATGGTGSGGESSEVGVLLGNGDGSFQAVVPFDTGAPFSSSVAVADVNGDGYPDLIVAHTCASFCNVSPITVLLGNGDGTFKAPQRFTSGGKNAEAVVATDVNGDGKPDLLVANSCVSNADCSNGVVAALLGISGVKTSTKLNSSLNPAVYGQSVTITATVSSVGPRAPTGTVKFMNGSVSLGSAAVSGGVASLTKTNLAAGILSITATYGGDTNSAKSTSAPLLQNIDQASTMMAVTSSVNPSTQGQAVKFTAKVASATTHATGSVTFTAGSATLGTVVLSSGKATLTTSALPKGSSQTITATYGGTANIVGSAGSVNQTVN